MLHKELPRERLSKLTIHQINIEIAAYEKVIGFYEDYISRKGSYSFVEERIVALNNEYTEYLIARELHIENQKICL
jgi:hypothetical protein